jgi:hypothetical protein
MLTGFAFASERSVEDCSARNDWDASDDWRAVCGARRGEEAGDLKLPSQGKIRSTLHEQVPTKRGKIENLGQIPRNQPIKI